MNKSRHQFQKTMVDPVFGLPVVKDSKAMDFARFRNSSQDKRLQTQIENLEAECRAKTTKHLVTKALTKDFLQTLNSDQERRVVCPVGLSLDQKNMFRKIRRGSAPSISLNEFDERLHEVRRRRLLQRRCSEVSEAFHSNDPTAEMTQQFRIVTTDGADRISTTLPLYKCKSTVKETRQRLTSCNIIDVSNYKPKSSRSYRHSDSDLFSYVPLSSPTRDAGVFNARSTASEGTRFKRRNTLPDLKLGGGTSSVTKLQPTSDMENKAFNRFIQQLRAKNGTQSDL